MKTYKRATRQLYGAPSHTSKINQKWDEFKELHSKKRMATMLASLVLSRFLYLGMYDGTDKELQ
jgi:hypothetical protein